MKTIKINIKLLRKEKIGLSEILVRLIPAHYHPHARVSISSILRRNPGSHATQPADSPQIINCCAASACASVYEPSPVAANDLSRRRTSPCIGPERAFGNSVFEPGQLRWSARNTKPHNANSSRTEPTVPTCWPDGSSLRIPAPVAAVGRLDRTLNGRTPSGMIDAHRTCGPRA